MLKRLGPLKGNQVLLEWDNRKDAFLEGISRISTTSTHLRFEGAKVQIHFKDFALRKESEHPAGTEPSRNVFPWIQLARYSGTIAAMVQGGPATD